MSFALFIRDEGTPAEPCWLSAAKCLGLTVRSATRPALREVLLAGTVPSVVILAGNGAEASRFISIAREVRGLASQLPIILIVEDSSEEIAIAALRAGITHYFRIPVEIQEFLHTLRQINFEFAPHRTAGETLLPNFVGDSSQMRTVRAALRRIAECDSNVLITGETGTGKELAACAIHHLSRRSAKPLVCINCAALPDALVESELFGYERGAFTGAASSNPGSFQAADHGTVVLDEIGDLSLHAQAKLLRVLEEKRFRPLGARGERNVNVRFIAATNCNLEDMSRRGAFRLDLYYRLNIARVHLPPLRDRRDDIPPLLQHYIAEFNRRPSPRPPEFTEEAWRCLLRYDWPGNIRELKNLVEAALIDVQEGKVSLDHLPASIREAFSDAPATCANEQEQLLSALLVTKWNKSKAAEKLHWSRMTVYRKIAKYRLVQPPGKTA
ncbi:MAG: sigma 54-interacting transcriptional regulator [Terriglobales bacterium]